MKKNVYIILLIAVLAIIATRYFFSYKPPSQEIIFFYSLQCPHCENVRNFVAENDVHSRVVFTEKEIVQDRANLVQLIKIQERCGIPATEYVKIPMLWTGSQCILGDDEIIEFLKQKMAQSQ
jgi:glutaredoxin